MSCSDAVRDPTIGDVMHCTIKIHDLIDDAEDWAQMLLLELNLGNMSTEVFWPNFNTEELLQIFDYFECCISPPVPYK